MRPTNTNETIIWPSNTVKGYMEAAEGDGIVMNRPYAAGGTVQPQSAPTLTTGMGGGTGTVIKMTDGKIRIRYLTPRECLRLMGQTDEDIDRLIEAEPTRTTQYRLAGNSIVVDCLMAIFDGIYNGQTFEESTPKQTSLEAYL